MISYEKILAGLAADIASTRLELEKLKVNPNLRTKIALESKLNTLEDLHDHIRVGGYREGGDLACTVGPIPAVGAA